LRASASSRSSASRSASRSRTSLVDTLTKCGHGESSASRKSVHLSMLPASRSENSPLDSSGKNVVGIVGRPDQLSTDALPALPILSGGFRDDGVYLLVRQLPLRYSRTQMGEKG